MSQHDSDGSRGPIPRIDPTRGGSGVAARVGSIARQRPPAPKGRGAVMALIGLAALVAVIYQFATGSGPAATVKKQREEDARRDAEASAPAVLAAPGPTESGVGIGPTPGLPPEEAVEVSNLPPRPAAARPGPAPTYTLPEGLDPSTARRLRQALASLQRRLDEARDGVLELPAIAAASPAASRPAVRAFVAQRLAALLRMKGLAATAMDAALALQGTGDGDAADLATLDEAVRETGLASDLSAAGALVYLEGLEASQREPAVEAITAVLKDAYRSLTVRVLAARTLRGWSAASEVRTQLAAEETTPAPLRAALE